MCIQWIMDYLIIYIHKIDTKYYLRIAQEVIKSLDSSLIDWALGKLNP